MSIDILFHDVYIAIQTYVATVLKGLKTLLPHIYVMK